MDPSGWVDVLATPPRPLPPRLSDTVNYLSEVLQMPVFVRWTPSALARAYGSMDEARAAQPEVFRQLLASRPVVQFWNAGQVQTLSESDAPTVEVVVARLLRTLRVRFRLDARRASLPDHNAALEGTPQPRQRIAASLDDEAWLLGAGPVMNPNTATNSLAVYNDAAATSLFLRDRAAASGHTRRAYVEEIRRFIRWCERRHIPGPLSALSREHFIAYREYLSNVGPQTCDIPIGASTQRRALAVLRSLLGYLWKTGYLVTNVAAGLSAGANTRTGFSARRILPDAAVRAIDRWLLDRLQPGQPLAPTRRAAIVALYRLTGVRLDELPQRDGYPRIVTGDEGWTLHVRGKGQRLREIPLPETCVAFLRHYRMACGLPADPPLHENLPLIHGQRSESPGLGPSGLYREVRAAFAEMAASLPEAEAAARLALQRASPHWLRHLVGRTLVIDANTPLPVAQVLLGHTSVATTATYARADTSRLRQVMQETFCLKEVSGGPASH
jgi:site-specific recombinase XerD